MLTFAGEEGRRARAKPQSLRSLQDCLSVCDRRTGPVGKLALSLRSKPERSGDESLTGLVSCFVHRNILCCDVAVRPKTFRKVAHVAGQSLFR